MSKCTAAQAVEAMMRWDGYYEKASSLYVTRRDKSVFELDKGSANMTYAGYHCGIQGGAWCAMQVSTAIDEACGGGISDAKAVMYGVWPYARCDQLYDAAPAARKGRRGKWTPLPGDVIVFGRSQREHTGMVYAVDGQYVYTQEGNSGNMCRKRSYLLTCDYIWGYVRPDYADAALPVIAGELYGDVCCSDPELHVLSKGTSGPEVKTVQRILYARGIMGADGLPVKVDGDFGANTKAAVISLQKWLGAEADGVVGAETWTRMLTGLA